MAEEATIDDYDDAVPEEQNTQGIEQAPAFPDTSEFAPNPATSNQTQTPEEQQEKYLKALFGRCEFGFIEIRAVSNEVTDRYWLPRNTVKIPKQHADRNVYIGVATRLYGKGKKEDLVQIPAVWVDCDDKTIAPALVKERIDKFPLKPSIHVKSGHGDHFYWLLKEPVGSQKISEIECINWKLADHLGGDRGVKDASHLLRLPGTMNVKSSPHCPATLEYANPDICYELSDFSFLDAPPPTTIPHPAVSGEGWLRYVSQGNRHTRAVEVAGHFIGMRKLGLDEVQTILSLWNEKNTPPLPQPELLRIISDLHKKHIAEQGAEPNTQDTKALTKEDFTAAMERVSLSVNDFIGLSLKENPIILKPWLREGDIVLITAERGIGKTWLGLSIGMVITHEWQIGDWRAEKHVGCAYIDGEMRASQLQRRLIDIRKTGMKGMEPFHIISSDISRKYSLPRINLGNKQCRDGLTDYLVKNSQYKVLILDNLVSLTSGIDENTKKDWDPINQWLLDMRAMDVAVIMIHHAGKSGGQRGTSAREDNIDVSTELLLPPGHQEEDGAKFVVKITKKRDFYGKDAAALIMELTTTSAGIVWNVKPYKRGLKEEITPLLNSGIKQSEIAEMVGCKAPYVTQVKKEAIKEGILDTHGKFTELGRQQFGEEEDVNLEKILA